MSGEPKAWTAARRARLAQQFPEFNFADAKTVMGVDGMRSARGEAPSQFSQTAMRLAAAAAQEKNA